MKTPAKSNDAIKKIEWWRVINRINLRGIFRDGLFCIDVMLSQSVPFESCPFIGGRSSLKSSCYNSLYKKEVVKHIPHVVVLYKYKSNNVV